MKQSRTRIKNLGTSKDFKYASRQYKDYALAKEMRDDLKVMAYVALGNIDFEIRSSKEKTDFNVIGKEKKYHWFCYVHGRGYMFFGESEIELYCNIISSIVGNRLYIPFSD